MQLLKPDFFVCFQRNSQSLHGRRRRRRHHKRDQQQQKDGDNKDQDQEGGKDNDITEEHDEKR
jgi:hypothetical protein